MIASYMDESFDPAKSGVFAVGGLLGRGAAFFELERKWEKLPKRSDIDIAYFKASQCERGTGEFAKFVADPKNIASQEREKLDLISRDFLSLISKEELVELRSATKKQQKALPALRLTQSWVPAPLEAQAKTNGPPDLGPWGDCRVSESKLIGRGEP